MFASRQAYIADYDHESASRDENAVNVLPDFVQFIQEDFIILDSSELVIVRDVVF